MWDPSQPEALLLCLSAVSSHAACGAWWWVLCNRSRRAARVINPGLEIGPDMIPRDPALARRFFRYLARDMAPWRRWCEWSCIIYFFVLNVKWSQAIYPGRQTMCKQEHKFYFRIVLLVFVVLKLLPIDRTRDIRVRWIANLFRLVMTIYFLFGYAMQPEYRLCLGEWMQELSCNTTGVMTAVSAWGMVMWLPMGVYMDAIWLPLHCCLLGYCMSQHTGAESAYRPGCEPLPYHLLLGCIAISGATMLKWQTHHLQLVRFLRAI